MSVEITTPAPSASTAPVDGAAEAPAVRGRVGRRYRGLLVPRSIYIAAAGAVAVLSLMAATVGLGIAEHKSQLDAVTVLEARAKVRTSDAPQQAQLPADEKTKALLADPVFSSPEWKARLAASREVRRGVHEADLALAEQTASDVWWPGLSGRAGAARGLLVPFDPEAGDGAELVAAVMDAKQVCEMSDPAAFVADWVAAHPVAGASAYEAAVAGVFPALVKAAEVRVCPPGTRVPVALPLDKLQQGR
jgi:hypothetical protein